MKKMIRPVILLLLCALLFSSCAVSEREIRIYDPDDGTLHFSATEAPFGLFKGIEWGMTKEQLLSALSIQEGQLKEGGKLGSLGISVKEEDVEGSDLCLYIDPSIPVEVSGIPAYRVGFSFMKRPPKNLMPGDGDESEYYLYRAYVIYQNQDDATLGRVSQAMESQYQKSEERIFVSRKPPVTVEKASEKTPYWYSKSTYQSVLSGKTEQYLRDFHQKYSALFSLHGETPVFSDEDWKVQMENSYLTEARVSHFVSPSYVEEQEYIITTYNGDYGCFAKLATLFS